VVENPPDPAVTVAALRTVMLYSIGDPFGLLPEEILWTGFYLDKILAPLQGRDPGDVPLAVRREMLDGTYSQILTRMERRGTAPPVFDPDVPRADINDWAAVLMASVTQCYSLRPMDESSMHGQLVGLLRELGVGDPSNPRGARYLPNDVRYRLAHAHDR
jgi:hypothetical protein